MRNQKTFNSITFEDIKTLICGALDDFYKYDRSLFGDGEERKEVCERCMVHRIAWYMLKRMDGNETYQWADLDCEYNRNAHQSKVIITQKPGDDEEKEHISFPDLIIHKRLDNEYNLLIIEFKRSNPNEQDMLYDYEKLKYFTDSKSRFKFRFGIYAEIHKDRTILRVFENGRQESQKDFEYCVL